MKEQLTGDVELWSFEHLSRHPEVVHFVSTRRRGRSAPPYDSLNLSFSTGDYPPAVVENRRKLAAALGITEESFVTVCQVHSGRVAIVHPDGPEEKKADALVSALPGKCLLVLCADCLPIILYAPRPRVGAVAHAGWRGTLERIAENTVRVMVERFGCRADMILAGIGPGIGPCCYRVGKDVERAVQSSGLDLPGVIRRGPDGVYLDLVRANTLQLLNAGVRAENIEVAGVCTRCRHDTFFSHRAANPTGRFGAGIMLKP